MAKKRNIESASVFEGSGIRAIRVRAIEVLLYPNLIDISFVCIHTLTGPNIVVVVGTTINDKHLAKIGINLVCDIIKENGDFFSPKLNLALTET